eukprot:superscaffoldBa00002592_g14744
MTIITKLDTQHPCSRLPRLSDKVPSESLLEDVNAALCTIPTRTITETNQLIYTTANSDPRDAWLQDEHHEPQRTLPSMEKEAGGQDQGNTERS